MSPPQDVVLFDLFGTIGSEVAASRAQRLKDFQVYPSARRLLAGLRERARLGVFSPDPSVPVARLTSLLTAKELIPPVDSQLVAVARRGDARAFERFLEDHALPAERVVFVSLSAVQRKRARDAGLRVAPHPALAAGVLDGESLHLARLSLRDSAADVERSAHRVWEPLLSRLGAVPVLLTREPDWVGYVFAPRRNLDALASTTSAGEVEFLGGPDVVAETTLVMLHLTREEANADQALASFLERLESGLPLARETPNGWLVALPAGRSLEELHPPPAGAGHGHSRVLLPDLSVLKAPAVRGSFHSRDPSSHERSVLEGLDAASLRQRMAAWSSHVRRHLEEPRHDG